MRRIPRNKAIDIVLAQHIEDVKEWVLKEDIESLRTWLYHTLELGRKSVNDMKEDYGNCFPLETDDE